MPNPFTREQRFGAEVVDRGCRSQRLRLQLAAFQTNGADALSFANAPGEALHAGSPIQNDLVTGTMSVAMRGKGRFLNVLTVEPGKSEIGDQLSVAEILEARRDFEIFSADKLDHAL